jgi:hypothetical protein
MNAWNQLLWLPMTAFVYGLEFMVQTLRAAQQAVQQIAPPTTLKETREMSQNCCDDQCGKPFCEVRLYEYYIVSVKPCHERVVFGPTSVVITSDMNGEAFTSYAIGLYCLDHKVSREDVKYLRVCYRINCTLPKERESCSTYARDQVEILRQIRDAIGGGIGGQQQAA